MKKKLLIALILSLLLSISTNAQINNSSVYKCLTSSVHYTFSPDKIGLGVIYTNHNIIASVELAQPTRGSEKLEMFKYGLGYKVYKDNYWNYSLNIIAVYNHIYYYEGKRVLLNPDNIHKYSIEIGFMKDIVRNLTCSFNYDVLNKDAKVGFGFKF